MSLRSGLLCIQKPQLFQDNLQTNCPMELLNHLEIHMARTHWITPAYSYKMGGPPPFMGGGFSSGSTSTKGRQSCSITTPGSGPNWKTAPYLLQNISNSGTNGTTSSGAKRCWTSRPVSGPFPSSKSSTSTKGVNYVCPILRLRHIHHHGPSSIQRA